MQDEASPLFNRPAAHHHAFADRIGKADHCVRVAQVEFVQNVGKAHIGQFLIDHQAHRAFFAVADQENDAFRKAFVCHVGHGNEELSFK